MNTKGTGGAISVPSGVYPVSFCVLDFRLTS